MSRVKMTKSEKLAQEKLGTTDYIIKNMGEDSVDSVLQKEKVAEFNSQVDEYVQQLENNKKNADDAAASIDYDITRAEIKPMFSRVLISPFKANPFQKMTVHNGIITDAGGYTPHAEINPVSGKYEEQKEFIVTGCVVDVGPETTYLKEGDVVYYRVDTSVPVPFFRQGLVSVGESQVIAVVAEGLTKRFKDVRG